MTVMTSVTHSIAGWTEMLHPWIQNRGSAVKKFRARATFIVLNL
jgi:hypothetical protein